MSNFPSLLNRSADGNADVNARIENFELDVGDRVEGRFNRKRIHVLPFLYEAPGDVSQLTIMHCAGDPEFIEVLAGTVTEFQHLFHIQLAVGIDHRQSACDERCEVSPVGPDGSIDILAGRGPLGLDGPRIVVQSKSGEGKVDAPTVQQLDSVISTLGADQGLLVAWGGITPKATQVLASKRFTIRIWEADDLIDALTDSYSMMSESIRAEIPLKQVWIPVEDAG